MSLLREKLGTLHVEPSSQGGYDLIYTSAVAPDVQPQPKWIDTEATTAAQAAHGTRAYTIAAMGAFGPKPDSLRIGRVNTEGLAPVTVRRSVRRTLNALKYRIPQLRSSR